VLNRLELYEKWENIKIVHTTSTIIIL